MLLPFFVQSLLLIFIHASPSAHFLGSLTAGQVHNELPSLAHTLTFLVHWYILALRLAKQHLHLQIFPVPSSAQVQAEKQKPSQVFQQRNSNTGNWAQN